jgi:hypothetical protein
VQLRKTINFVSPEEKQAIMAEYNSGLLSKASAIAMLGTVEDVDSELILLEEEAATAMEKAQQQQDLIEDDPNAATEQPTNNPNPDELGEPDE